MTEISLIVTLNNQFNSTCLLYKRCPPSLTTLVSYILNIVFNYSIHMIINSLVKYFSICMYHSFILKVIGNFSSCIHLISCSKLKIKCFHVFIKSNDCLARVIYLMNAILMCYSKKRYLLTVL